MLLLIPVLAFFDIFGETSATIRLEDDALSVEIRYPTKFRYKQINEIQVAVVNRSNAPIDTVTVAFDPSYISDFSTVQFTPSVEKAFQVPLTDVEPGETRLVEVELQAEQHGRHSGRVIIATADADSLEATLSTFTFP